MLGHVRATPEGKRNKGDGQHSATRTGLKIEIDAVLIMTPTPERMRLRTTINLDNGLAD